MKRLVLILLLSSAFSLLNAQDAADSAVFRKFLAFAKTEKLASRLPGERVAAVGRFFLGTPYEANTLEAPGPERLQVNLHGLDCTTLVENALALSRLVVSKKPDFDTYRSLLNAIRYRSGKLDGYSSRLHYASDWLTDNVQKGFLSFVDLGAQAEVWHPKVGYMTTHPSAYAALRADSTLLPVLAAQEAAINQRSFGYLPKERVSSQAPCIHTGDLLAITTAYPGLDFSHLGIAVRRKGKVYLLHASTSGKKVLISEKPLSEYLAEIKKHTGIVVLRPL